MSEVVDLEGLRKKAILGAGISSEEAIQLAEEVEGLRKFIDSDPEWSAKMDKRAQGFEQENDRLQKALEAQKEYVEFLEEACKGAEAIAAIHGMTVSKETFEKGEQLRAKIAARTPEPSNSHQKM